MRRNLMIFTKKSSRFLYKNSNEFSVVICFWKSINSMTIFSSIYYGPKKMLQWTLLSESDINQQSVCLGNIKAMFVKTFDDFYDVILEVNSQKFFIRVSRVFDQIVEFEILAIKWFVEVSRRIVEMIKSLVDHLFCRLD